ncbi:MAG: phosphatase [Leptolyngbya sp. SIO4C1]|nr:phosphatase [Leptolyngbya sp. SIO4C1]
MTDICNYLPLNSQVATSGQPSAEQFADIKAAGYEQVINLAMPSSNSWLPAEPEIVRKQGMAYQHIPVVWENPTAENLAALFATLDEARQRDLKVWVHCAMNMRVSTMMYLYSRLRLGRPDAEARALMAQIWTPNEVWERFIEASLSERY